MLIEIALAILIGLIIGVITGLTPGIHNNTVNAMLLALIPSLPISPMPLIIFVVVLAITHTTLDFIPSIFTGATDGESFMATLPGHDMLNEGKGTEAVMSAALGTRIAIPIILVITPLFVIVVPKIIESIKIAIPFILIFVSIYIVIREKYIYSGLSVWILSGFLGYSALNLPITEPLLPLLSGLFGGSGLILSIIQKTKIPKQKKIKKIKFEKNALSVFFPF